MIKKFTLLLLAMLCIAGTSKASEYDLDISQLDGSTYNKSTHVFDFGTSWAENQWWIGTVSPLDISSYGEFIVEYTGATSASKYRVYLEPVAGTTQTVEVTASQTIGRNVIKLKSELNSIKKIVISDAGTAFQMTLKRAYFRSKTNENSTWSQDVSWNWTAWNNQYLNDAGWKSKFANAKVEDIIRITYSSATEGSKIYSACDASSTNEFGNEAVFSSLNPSGGTVEYIIPNAAILENIQLNGMVVKGQNATITNVSLYSYTESYDAVPVTIGSDGIATFSTSAKKLNFTGTDIYPYYASLVAEGTVTLTKVTDQLTYAWQGYILEGTPGIYEIPVTSIDGSIYPGTNYLRPIGDYAGKVYKSVYSDYSGGGGDETNIKNKYRYIFAKHSGNIGFYLLGTDYSESGNPYHTLAAHKAYLETAKDLSDGNPATSRGLTLNFGDGTTAIWNTVEDKIDTGNVREDGVYYTLQGTRVQNPSKGLYILNGKKVVVK